MDYFLTTKVKCYRESERVFQRHQQIVSTFFRSVSTYCTVIAKNISYFNGPLTLSILSDALSLRRRFNNLMYSLLVSTNQERSLFCLHSLLIRIVIFELEKRNVIIFFN
jgi:hypothetical protein